MKPLSGRLEDLSFIDILQLLSVSGKTGVLKIDGNDKKARIGLLDGRIFSARLEPRLTYMVDLLIERGDINLETLHRALRLQRRLSRRERRPIGAILVEMEALKLDQIEEALRVYIQNIINEVASWIEGVFSFDADEVEPVDSLSFLPDSVAPSRGFRIQEIILEAVRISEEARDRDQRMRTKLTAEGVIDETSTMERVMRDLKADERRRPVVLFSSDDIIRYSLRERLQRSDISVLTPVSDRDAFDLLEENRARRPFFVVDTDATEEGLIESNSGVEMMKIARKRVPDIDMVSFGIVVDPEVFAEAVSAGAMFHAPKPSPYAADEVEVVRTFSHALADVVERQVARSRTTGLAETNADGSLSYLGVLYRNMTDLRSTIRSPVVSLGMLRYMAQYLERAILFVIDRKQLMGIGLFGVKQRGAGSGKNAVNLRLDIDSGPAFKRAVEEKKIQTVVDLEDDPALQELYMTFGAPIRSEAYVLPLVIRNRTASLVYADNGRSDLPLCPAELVGALMEYTGLILENLLLRRKAQKAAKAPDKPRAKSTRSPERGNKKEGSR